MAVGGSVARVTAYQVMLSATPINLRNEDLFKLLRLLDPDHFASVDDFGRMLEANRPLVAARDAVLNPSMGVDVVMARRLQRGHVPGRQRGQRRAGREVGPPRHAHQVGCRRAKQAAGQGGRPKRVGTQTPTRERPSLTHPSRRLIQPRDTHMNWDRIEGKWKQFKGNLREQWGKLTDDQLEVIAGKRQHLAGKIQESYGLSKDETEKQLSDWHQRCKASFRKVCSPARAERDLQLNRRQN